MMLTKDELTSFARLAQEIDVPALGGSVYARPLSGVRGYAISNMEDFAASTALIRYSVCDKDGAPLFDSDEEVGELPSLVFAALLHGANKVNGLLDDSLEQAEKNSGMTAVNGSGTPSPTASI